MHMLSQLPCLHELVVKDIYCDHNDLDGIPGLNSDSLRPLSVRGYTDVSVVSFLNLFAECHIDCISVKPDAINEVDRLGDILESAFRCVSLDVAVFYKRHSYLSSASHRIMCRVNYIV